MQPPAEPEVHPGFFIPESLMQHLENSGHIPPVRHHFIAELNLLRLVETIPFAPLNQAAPAIGIEQPTPGRAAFAAKFLVKPALFQKLTPIIHSSPYPCRKPPVRLFLLFIQMSSHKFLTFFGTNKKTAQKSGFFSTCS